MFKCINMVTGEVHCIGTYDECESWQEGMKAKFPSRRFAVYPL